MYLNQTNRNAKTSSRNDRNIFVSTLTNCTAQFLNVFNYIEHHHPFKATFQAAPYQNVRYIFWDPPLNVKLVAERPPGVVFVGSVVKIPSKCKLTFSRPPQKDLEQCN